MSEPWIRADSGDIELTIGSHQHGDLVRQSVVGLYLIWKWSGRGDVLLSVHVPAGTDMDGRPTEEIEYEVVIREKMR